MPQKNILSSPLYSSGVRSVVFDFRRIPRITMQTPTLRRSSHCHYYRLQWGAHPMQAEFHLFHRGRETSCTSLVFTLSAREREGEARVCTRFVLLTRFRPRSSLLAQARRLHERVPIANRVISDSFRFDAGVDHSRSTGKLKFVGKSPRRKKGS